MPDDFPITDRTRLRRRPQRGAYDRVTVFGILDAGVMCHVGYVVNGKPVVTPTAYWRHGDDIYWHGSAASRMLNTVDGAEVCVTVSHLDGLVVARSAFHQSVNYRSVMIFGQAQVLADIAQKRVAMHAFVERLYPGRSTEIRESSDKELQAISVIKLTITEAAAKVRGLGVVDDDDDYAIPTWAGVIPIKAIIGKAVPDQRLLVDPQLPANLADFAAGARLDEVLARHG
jgi:nitroimidazol reductase NimA-like FMN-containing flavoprotein (pyridoxamine 5'-phosphate oxidase superfamily)